MTIEKGDVVISVFSWMIPLVVLSMCQWSLGATSVVPGPVPSETNSMRTVWFCLLDQRGQPVTNATVEFGEFPIPGKGSRHTGLVRPDAYGKVRAELQDAKVYELNCSPALHEPFYLDRRLRIDPGVGDAETKAIPLVATNTYRRIQGRVVDPDGKPVSGVRMVGIVMQDEGIGGEQAEVLSGDDGSYDLVLARAYGPLHLKGYKEGYLFDNEMLLSVTQDMGVVFAILPDARAKITCRLVQKDAPNARVAFNGGLCFRNEKDTKGRIEWIQVTNGIGTGRLPEGVYRVYSEGLESSQRLCIQDIPVTVSSQQTNFVLCVLSLPMATLNIRDKKTGEPLNDVAIWVDGWQVTNGVDGHAGIYMTAAFRRNPETRIRRKGYMEVRTVLSTGAEQTILLVPTDELAVGGVVVDEMGDPVADALVSVITDKKGQRREKVGRSGKDGRFTVDGVEPLGGYILVRKSGFASYLEPMDPQERAPQKIVLKHGIPVVFDVVVDNAQVKGEKLQAGVVALCAKGTKVCYANIWMGGKAYREPVLMLPGEYRLIWLGENHGFVIQDIVIRKAGTTEQTVTAPEDKAVMSLSDLMQGL